MQRECACRVQLLNIRNVVWYKQNNPSAPLAHNRVRKIYEDKEGDVWICTDHGINLYQKSTGKLLNFIVYDKTGKYSTAWAYDILQDQKGRMWMASYQGGVFVLDKQRLLAAISLSSAATATCVADYHSQTRERTPFRACISVSWYSMEREWSGHPLIIISTVSIPVPFASPISLALMPSII